MRARRLFLYALLFSSVAFGQAPLSRVPEVVEIPDGTFHLKAYLWKPAGLGPFPAVMFNHGRSDSPQQHTRNLTITASAKILGPVFAKHGYVFLYPFRRGEGLSADQGAFIGDLLRQEQVAKGDEAHKHLLVTLMTTDHLGGGKAALSFLKNLRDVDTQSSGGAPTRAR